MIWIWRGAGWLARAAAAACFIIGGLTMSALSWTEVLVWLGPEPWSVPFFPTLNSHYLLFPVAPFRALIARGDWMPITMLAVYVSSYPLWKSGEFSFERAREATNLK